jgi:amino acid adenylation domain-containing protein
LDTIVQRHETLRTIFIIDNGEPKQQIAPEGLFPLQVTDVRNLEQTERELRVRLYKTAEEREKFSLDTGPLIRGRLVQSAPEEHVLLITMHHIVSDGWSVGVLIREISTLYTAYRNGEVNPLPPLPIQYADYTQWQRQWLLGERLDRQLSYWRERLEGAPPLLELPTDRPRPAVQSYRGKNLPVTLDEHLTTRLKELAQQRGMTLFMLLYAGWVALLSRLSNQDDVIVGTPIANRQRPELESLIGFFVNTLALRIQGVADLTVERLLEQVKETTLGAYRHQDVPFEKIVETLQPERSLGRNPIFQVMLALQNAPTDEFNLLGVTATLEEGTDHPSLFDLFLSLEERGGRLVGSMSYATDLFEPETIARWITYYTILLDGMLVTPHGRVHNLPLMPPIERQLLAETFNATRTPYPREKLIHQLFEEQVERTPDAPAVVGEDRRLTYAELETRANQLARYLRSKQIGPDQLVALCTHRGTDMVVGLLSILKAGGAYLPLDPDYPPERLAYLLEDSNPKLLLTQARLKERIPETTAEIIALDSDWETITPAASTQDREVAEPDWRPSDLRPHHLAYVIYTSGSTGRPKAVAIEHRNTVNLISWAHSAWERDLFAKTLQSTSLNFDLSVYEIFVPLTTGGTLVVVQNALCLANQPTDVTLINTVPSALSGLLDSGGIPQHTRIVNLAGEALKKELVERIFASTRVEQVWNLYGPSETTTYSTWACMTRDTGFVATIGRPIANTQIHILDRHLQGVPIGVTGEIYIGGAGVARGYLNRPDLTSERFIQNPFSDESDARLYKTGDLGRWRPDGSIEYLGRTDHQVKIRGYRIELGEIEAQISSHEHVKQAVVVAREDTPGDKRLVAYIVSDRHTAASTADDVASEDVTSWELSRALVEEWGSIWQETYARHTAISGPSFIGWNSSYTGQPIPEPEMQEWLTSTLERIQALRPQRVLEIGCGVGLILQHLAPQCQLYVATDFSTPAIEQLARWKSTRPDLQHVQLLVRSALETQHFEPGSFDTVVLNSVVQYFPNIDYLLTVLQSAIRLLRPGGRIFLGDVRHLPSLPIFHSAVQLAKAATTLTLGALKKRITHAMAREKELVIDPRFFEELPTRIPGISAVEIHLKRGQTSNELTRYRYDVVARVGAHIAAQPVHPALSWKEAVGSLAALEDILQQRLWPAARLTELPNARVAREAAAQHLIEAGDDRQEVGALRRQVNDLPLEEIAPEAVWALGEKYGYNVQLTWSEQGSPGTLDALLLDRERVAEVPRTVPHTPNANAPLSAYATEPLDNSFRQQLVPRLRDFLKRRLPEHLLPAAWVVLKELPLTPNGKVDRRALPAPQQRPEEIGEYTPPRTDLERTLADIWAQVLRVDQVGAHDNFFELGGHSLLIVQLMERLRRLGLTADIRSIYARPTLADLAQSLSRAAPTDTHIPPNLIPPACHTLTPQMLPLVRLEPEHIEHIVQATPGGAPNIQDIYPLAPLQEGLLFHHLLNPQRGDAYVRPLLLSLPSRKSLDALTTALQHVIDRHDILRTAVLWEQLPQPLQVVSRHVRLPVEHLALDDTYDVLEQLKQHMQPQHQRLDLRQAPLIRLQLAPANARVPQGAPTDSDEPWYALLQTHHLICDNESLEILLSEIAAHHQGHLQALPAPLPYRNHVAQSLAQASKHQTQAFFRDKLGDISEPTAPFGLLDVRADGSRIQTARQHLECTVASRIRLQARRLGISAATLFHAAWALVVAHTSGRDDVVFGTVLLGRMQGGARTQLGLFINTLPLRLPLRDLTAEALVRRTQQELAQLLTHEQASLATAQRCSAIDASAPLFTSLLNYRISTTDLEASFAQATGATVLAGHGGTNYPIVFSIDDQHSQFALEVETDQRIDPDRMMRYAQTSLESLIEALEQNSPSMSLELSILPQSEHQLLLESFNSTDTPYPQHALVHELFEAQARQTPDALAVICSERRISYAELNKRANQLALYLQSKGIGPNKLVAICLERSLEMIVGLLATLKSGAAYVPLDPRYPTQRIAHVLEDATPHVIITQQHLKHRMPPTSATIIALDSGLEQIHTLAQNGTNPVRTDCDPSHLAYVIYTSGSTGRPKGVMVPHSSVVNFLNAMTRRPGITPTDRLLAVTTVSFDIAGLEIYLPLVNGASLVLTSPEESSDGNALSVLIEKYDITLLQGTPATWRLLLGAGWAGKPTLKALCGGEALPRDLSREIASRVASLWNLYGPTETTIWSCCHPITPPSHHGNDALVASAISPVCESAVEPIGSPIDNTHIYILNSHKRPPPLGVPGEIYIAGAGVARGYLNRPQLTAEKFLKDPFSPRQDARMYKTGDLGRWRPDGTLEYLGRNDHQVKIRGFRIELGEIESQLIQHPQVLEAAVLAREDHPGEKRLVAYIVHSKASRPNDDAFGSKTPPSTEALRTHLRSTLPDYMVPSAFVVLQSLPRTLNGKLNRLALPAPEQDSYITHQYEPPQGQVEEILAGIWHALLRRERISRHDNFFELGGHSLLIVQMLERLRRAGLSAQLRLIFASPILKDLANTLTRQSQDIRIPPNQIPANCVTITPPMLPLVQLEVEHIERITRTVPGGAANIQDIYPLTPLQEGLLFHHLLDERADTYIRTLLLSVSSRGHLDDLIVALQAAIDRHDVLRTAFLWDQLPRPVQVVYRKAVLPVENIQLSPHQDSLGQLQQRMQQEQHLDLCNAPPVHAQIASDPHSTQWYALIRTHHLVCDNQSIESLLSELTAQIPGSHERLPTPRPYREHVAQTLAVSNAAEEEAFFKSKFADIDEPTAPFGLANVRGETHVTAKARDTLSTELSGAIRLQARKRAVSAATLFHAAWALVVAQTSGRDDVVFGTVLLGRMHSSAGAQQMLGLFINTLPLRLRLKDLTAAALVEQTQRELIELLSHEQSSLALAQRCSGVPSSVPLFSALLNYRHSAADIETTASNGASVRLLASHGGTNYPVLLCVDDDADGFSLEIEVDPQIEPQRMLVYVSTALQSLVRALDEAPLSPVLSWPVLPEHERHQVIEVFNATSSTAPTPERPPAGEELIHQLFERQVKRTPDAVAVHHETESLTYAELNAKANQVARLLRQKGIGPDQTVGLCVERAVEMMTGLLGILKAGGAYIPLDPGYSAGRLAYMLADAAPRVVLTQERLRPRLPTRTAEVISLDQDWHTMASQETGNLDPKIAGLSASHLAYVIYTSGSTGNPKGVMIEHRNVVNHWRALEPLYRKPHDCRRIGANAPFTFDASVQQFIQLLSGCTLYLVPQGARLDPKSLLTFLARNQIEGIDCTPSQLSAWLSAGLLNDNTSLRTVLVGGEAIDPGLWTTLSRSSRVTFYNVYGPTECTVDSTATLINRAPPTPHIGHPLENTRVYILDAYQRPAPIGVVGEINVAGGGVARGYLNRPELTAERFVHDPFSNAGACKQCTNHPDINANSSGTTTNESHTDTVPCGTHGYARLYKTGDLGRWRPDGTIEYLGRNDAQVKIRGFRIELGEIEAQLTRHRQVKQAVVIAREDTPGAKHLVAYVVPTAAHDRGAIGNISTSSLSEIPKVESLRSHLKSVLPDHMIPNAFVLLERLPITSNGKLDRRALPTPERDSFISYVSEAPQGEIEEALAKIWRGLLRIEQVGRDDNFFELGGHSLHAVKLLAHAHEQALEGLSIHLIFKHPTIRQMAERMTRKGTAVTEPAGMEFEEGLL